MAKIYITRSIEIDASKQKVFGFINDFNMWVKWSPWLLMEPDALVEVEEDRQSYKWDGKRIGSGNMKIIQRVENESIDFDLNFLKPWKSSSKTSIHLEEIGEGKTKVTWTMNSSLPLFMFWMRSSMEAYVGADYERGLSMLKALVETGDIPSKLEFSGVEKYDGCKWIGIETESYLDTVATQMQADFAMLWGFVEKNKDLISGEGFTMYEKWDFVKNKVKYTAAIPVHEIPAEIPGSFTSGERSNANTYQLKHSGSYHHLGNAWSTGYAMMRNKEFKYNKKVKPFEVYLNNPSDTDPKDLITVVHFPVKK